MSSVQLKLDWASHAAAKYACENWHYSKCMPAGKLVKVGVWEDKKFIGVVIFSGGPTPNMWKTYGLTPIEGAELSRVALTSHTSSVSRIVSIAIKFLKKFCPKLKLIISYADTEQDHIGTIYQAGNWLYVGKYGDNMYNVIRKSDKKKVHMRNAREEIARGRAKKDWFIWSEAKPKYKYLMPLEDKEKYISLVKQYPKRAVSKENVAAEYHSAEGGVNPTTALQTKL